MTDLIDDTLATFVDAVGSGEPTPGAGAAGAVALALAAACLAKALAISARHVESPDALIAAAEEARELSRLALVGARRDAEDFGALLHAKGRTAGPRAELRQDGETLLALANRIRRIAEAHSARIAPTMAGDIVAALALAAASDRIQRSNLADAET
jgi:hypothetical protein